MANWQDDPDLAAMRSQRGKTPWARVLLGVLVVGCGTFGLAYYLPLYRAHKSLADDHARLRTELEGVQQKLTKAESELKDVSSKRDALDEQVKKQEAKSAGAASDAASLKSGLESAVDKLAKKKLAVVGTDASGARVALAAAAVFSAGKLEASGSGTSALCAIAKAAGNRPLHVIGVATGDDVPAALKSSFSNAWAYTSAAAGEAASVLHEKCNVAGAKLYAEGSDGSRPTSPAFSGDKPPSPRLEVLIATEAKP